MKIKIMACMFSLAVASAWAASVSTDADGGMAIDVPEGETYEHVPALTGGMVTKTGAGTLKLVTAAPGYTGTLAVNAGFVDVAVVDAAGRGEVVVAAGAGVIVSHDSGGQQKNSFQAVAKIAGAGPDGQGALRYTRTPLGDQIFKKVVLTADAAMGGLRSGTLEMDMQGHTLTWKGTCLMSLDCAWKNFGAIVHEGTQDICFQTGSFDATCTADRTITLNTDAGSVTFWNTTMRVPFKLVVNANSRVQANWGGGFGRNTWAGPVVINAGKTLTLATGNDEVSLCMAGPITGPGAVATASDTGIIYLDNEANAWTGGTTVRSFRLMPLSPATLPGLLEGKVSVPCANDRDDTVCINLGPAKAGANVQHVWTRNEIQGVLDALQSAGQFGGVSFDVPAGMTAEVPNDLARHFGVQGNEMGVVRFTGTVSNNASVNVRGSGRAVLDAPGAHTHRSFRAKGQGGVIHVKQGSHTLAGGMIRVANGTRGAVWQDAGTEVKETSEDTGFIGEGDGAYGAWLLDGGLFSHKNSLIFGAGKSYGALVQKGGTYEQASGTMRIGHEGDAVVYVGGGTNWVHADVGRTATQLGLAAGGVSALTVDGTGSVVRTGSLILGDVDGARTNILNLVDGGALEADRLYKNCYYKKDKDATAATMPPGSWNNGSGDWYIPFSNGCFSVINANGGVLVPTFAWGWNHIGGTCPPRDPDRFVLFENGLVIDTSKSMNGERSDYAGHMQPFHLDAPTGRGFAEIILPTNNATFLGQKYIGPARIRIEDATGWGATAFADFDKEKGKLVGVKLTSPGCDYSANPTVLVESADRKSTFACTFTLVENVSGGLTKRGTQTAEIYGACTYAGTTCVESGTLRLATAESVAPASHYRAKKGATLQLSGAATLKSVGGAGMVTGGAVTAAGVRAHAEDLNARQGLSVNNALAFAEGAVVTAEDPAAISGSFAKAPLVTATSAIVGTPLIDRDALPAPYTLKFSDDRKTLYLVYPRGTALILR